MIASKKTITILSVLLILSLIFTTFMVVYQPKKLGEKEENTMVAFAKYDNVDDIIVMSVKNEKGEYTAANRGGGDIFVVDQDEKIANTEALSSLLSSLSIVYATNTVVEEVQPEKLNEYGLESPRATVIFMDKKESGLILKIGNKAPDGESTFFTIEGLKGVYLMENERADIYLRPISHYLNYTFYPSLKDKEIQKLTEITMMEGSTQIKYNLRLAKFSEMANLVYYNMTMPYMIDTDRELLDMNLLAPLVNLKGEELVGQSPKDSAKFGVDSPFMQFTLTIDKTDYTVMVGKTEGEYTYCQTMGQTNIYSVKNENLEFLKLSAKDAIGESVYRKNITTIENITLEFGGEVHSYDIAGEGTELTIKEGGTDVNVNKFLDLFTQLMAIPMEGEAKKASTPNGVFVMDVKFRDGDRDVIKLLPIDDRKCLIELNGSGNFYTYQTIVPKIKSYVDNLK